MFMFKASTYLNELEAHRPDIFKACRDAQRATCRTISISSAPAPSSRQSPSESIDYAVMEKTQRSVVLPIDVGWSDVGSWKALWEVSARDAR